MAYVRSRAERVLHMTHAHAYTEKLIKTSNISIISRIACASKRRARAFAVNQQTGIHFAICSVLTTNTVLPACWGRGTDTHVRTT